MTSRVGLRRRLFLFVSLMLTTKIAEAQVAPGDTLRLTVGTGRHLSGVLLPVERDVMRLRRSDSADTSSTPLRDLLGIEVLRGRENVGGRAIGMGFVLGGLTGGVIGALSGGGRLGSGDIIQSAAGAAIFDALVGSVVGAFFGIFSAFEPTERWVALSTEEVARIRTGTVAAAVGVPQ